MPTYYLRAEGVNLSLFVGDTSDLSTIRGSGLALLFAYRSSFEEECVRAGAREFSAVSSGASVALYRFEANDDEAAESVVRAAHAHFVGDEVLGHATYVIDWVRRDSDRDFAWHVEALVAKNRWQQMRAPTLAIPTVTGTARGSCELDRLRPAAISTSRKGERIDVSTSVAARRERGIQYKQQLFDEVGVTGATPTPGGSFAWDFEEIADHPGAGRLSGKLAVLYADGNKFGQIQRAVGRDESALRDWDTTLREYRRALLERILVFLDSREDAAGRSLRFRFETLMWGGDELVWAAPAWLGWDLLRLFFEATSHWTFPTARDAGESTPLTHAVGLVLCHHTAPIHRVRRLAEDLAREVKDSLARDAEEEGGPLEDRFAYQVLESFDHLGGDVLAQRRAQRAEGAFGWLPGKAAATIADAIAALRGSVPRRRVHRIARAALRPEPQLTDARSEPQGRSGEAVTPVSTPGFEEVRKQLLDNVPESLRRSVQNAETVLGSVASNPESGLRQAWIHLNELWDYTPSYGADTRTTPSHA